MAQSQRIQKQHLEDIEWPAEFESPEDLLEHVVSNSGEPVFFAWNGGGFVIDGLPTWCFERFDEDAGRWDPLTDGFETAEELFYLPFLDGKSLRERFAGCRFFVE
ncbi:MAG: hypothetical protein Q4A07_05255 [Coriobacteriales bacterium]|nr:hypothetical protein [Coriobacteriales bacterium]